MCQAICWAHVLSSLNEVAGGGGGIRSGCTHNDHPSTCQQRLTDLYICISLFPDKRLKNDKTRVSIFPLDLAAVLARIEGGQKAGLNVSENIGSVLKGDSDNRMTRWTAISRTHAKC